MLNLLARWNLQQHLALYRLVAVEERQLLRLAIANDVDKLARLDILELDFCGSAGPKEEALAT